MLKVILPNTCIIVTKEEAGRATVSIHCNYAKWRMPLLIHIAYSVYWSSGFPLNINTFSSQQVLSKCRHVSMYPRIVFLSMLSLYSKKNLVFLELIRVKEREQENVKVLDSFRRHTLHHP